MTKENYPGLLTTTAGGHVEVGDDYLTAAIKEVYEETGLVIPKDELNFLGFKKYLSHDPLTGTYNYSFRAFYGFVYRDDLAALKAEAGAGDGFETLALETILELPEEVKVRIVPSIVDEDKYGDIYLALGELVK